MIIALGDIYARIADRDQVTALMRATQERARAEPGCIDYAFSETLDDPGHFLVVGQWRDRASLEKHYRSEAFANYQAGIGEHVVRISELRLYEVQGGAIPVSEAPIAAVQED